MKPQSPHKHTYFAHKANDDAGDVPTVFAYGTNDDASRVIPKTALFFRV